MRPLPRPEHVRLLLSFDFDGTLHNPATIPAVNPRLFDALNWLRATHGAIWGINTGRSMQHLVHGLLDGKFPFLPDYAIVCEREIFFPNELGRFLSYKQWNRACEDDLQSVFRKARKTLKKMRAHVEAHTGAQWVEQVGEPAGIIARTDEEMDWIVSEITPMAESVPELGWQRSTVYLRFGHVRYQKGTALAEVARLHSLTPQQTFAMGDSHNDLEMLRPEVAAYIACPSNSVADVLLQVNACGGYISIADHSHGVFEALGHFFGATEPQDESQPALQ